MPDEVSVRRSSVTGATVVVPHPAEGVGLPGGAEPFDSGAVDVGVERAGPALVVEGPADVSLPLQEATAIDRTTARSATAPRWVEDLITTGT